MVALESERWSAEDGQQWKDRIAYADMRLEAWARWSRTDGPRRLYFPRSSAFARVMTPSPDELQAGARHVAPDATDEQAMEIDAILADWKVHHRGWWKVARKEYLSIGPSEVKASELGMKRAEYRRQLDNLKIAIWRELKQCG